MREIFGVLEQVPLFVGIAPGEYPALLSCVGATTATYAKGDFLSLLGDEIRSVGVGCRGGVRIVKEDVFGNRAVLNDLGVGEVFGESFLCGGADSLTVSVQATEDATVLLLPFDKVMQSCPSACQFHSSLIKNIVVMIARKNLTLVEKLEVTTKHSLREKVLAYLSQLAQRQGGARVTSPLGRTNLADFMGADRSALTRELNRMRDEGLIEYKGNEYRLLGVEVPPG